jgi:fibronectin type 3 domain-containing protein
VILDWNNSPEGDVAGYYVYRAGTSGGPYSRVTPALLTSSAFTDTGLINGSTYYYVVTAVDTASAESVPSSQVQASPTDIDPTLAAYWQLNEGGGLTAFDSSGNGMNGSLVNGPTWTTGRVGGALSFDGVNDHVTTNLTENLTNWTVAAWVWSPAAPTSAPASGPVNRDQNLQINWNHEYPNFQGTVALSVGGQWYSASFGALAANTWYHLVGTYDGDTLRAYVNGVLMTANTAPSGNPSFESLPLEIGAHAGAPQYFNGVVDDVRIYRRALSAAEIAALAQPDPTPPSAVTLTANTVGQAVSLSWTAATDPESGIGGYRIFRGTVAGGSKALITSVSGATLSYLDGSTGPATTYYYQVSAVNNSGVEGPRSNEAAAVTGNTPPGPPTGLSAIASNAQVALDWNNSPEGDLAGYYVYRSSTSGGPYTRVTPTLLTVSAFTDTGLTNGTTYYYVVTAVDAASAESTSSNQAQATPTNVDPTLAAYWALDDAGGLTALDSSGNGMNGTLVNGPTWTTGRIGGGLSFDGVNDHVSTNFTEQLNTWTVAVWVRSPAAPTFAPSAGPLNRDKNFQINWNHEYPNYQGSVALSVANQWYPASFGPLAANTWYHLAATYDGQTLRAYTNGVLVTANAAPSGNPDFEALALELGAHAGAAQYFNGIVDDVRIYRRVLSAAEIAALAGQ